VAIRGRRTTARAAAAVEPEWVRELGPAAAVPEAVEA